MIFRIDKHLQRCLILAQPFHVYRESRVRMGTVPWRGSMHLWPCCLLWKGRDWSSVCSQPRAAEQLVDSNERAAIHYSRSCWAFYLEAAQNLGVTNIGWSVIPFPLFYLSQPLGPLPSVYCLREMQHSLASDLEPIYCVHTREKIYLHVFNLDLLCWQSRTNLYKCFFIF